MKSIVARLRSYRFRSPFDHTPEHIAVFRAPGPHTNLDSLSRHIAHAIRVLNEDRNELNRAFSDAQGSGRVRFKSKFRNTCTEFHGPGEVLEAIAQTDEAIAIFASALNQSQNEPHADFSLISENLRRIVRPAA